MGSASVHISQEPINTDELQLAHGMCALVQACSILYKTKLPLLLVFNKVDVARHEFAVEWMRDYEAFSEALQKDTSYAATLSRSLSLVIHSCTMPRLKDLSLGLSLSKAVLWYCAINALDALLCQRLMQVHARNCKNLPV